MANQIIVVGGGLTGLSAAHTILERGGNVLLLDKNSFMGGNSTKATSGINGALTNTQIALGIQDSAMLFYEDSARSARDLIDPSLTRVLTYNSASAVEWLKEKFELDLSLVSRLGGHSQPRTHRGKERFPGMTITYALMEKFEALAKEQPARARYITKAKVTRLLRNSTGDVTGVEYETADKQKHEAHGPVILATGGYAADFTENSLLKKHRPDIYDLPTTNGDWSTGDGQKMAMAIGAKALHLEKVQVHPTGLVDPKEPDAKVKFLAAEALRGVGGLLLDANGNRFCDELGHRDYVTGEMWKNKGPFRLVLNTAASKEIEWHCKHYAGRGLMKHFANGQSLAKEMGIAAGKLDDTFKKYNEIAATKKDPFGKKFFHNVPISMTDDFHVAIVTPVLHFTMGGIGITPDSQVRAADDKVIPGLFAAGEVAGGVHGANRLGGSSLLGCVVFGRVAGDAAARYQLGQLVSTDTAQRRLAGLGQQLDPNAAFTVNVSVQQPSANTRVQLNLGFTGQESASAAATAVAAAATDATATAESAAPAAAAPPKKQLGEYSAADVAKHNTEKDCWVIVNNQVLDVTDFLADHPGGKKAILLFAGKDATEEFNMLHKPDVVEKYAPNTVIGTLKK
ncbi:FAD binding domain-containing protein [Syncephalis pseudoplumigaleata]|uniref:fumarate reductase (NADH) n=1 Tax=Syncephalis pseudoplumigaleata TaxID=1712513 RepID=A0A4P9Z2B8_9FUNG|nr:FAD binding domain-containing protein [Syncephalis pseudoplumigaleata]|eukprot:RKP26505.1 FAD binding domain-containing protein [Syncephalis pseudoplumigaleata]